MTACCLEKQVFVLTCVASDGLFHLVGFAVVDAWNCSAATDASNYFAATDWEHDYAEADDYDYERVHAIGKAYDYAPTVD